MDYVRIEEIEPAHIDNCADGLFQATGSDIFGNILITTDGETRYAVYLNNPKGPSYVKLNTNDVRGKAGILWPMPAIEVDPTTQYDYERLGGAAGDLVIVKGRTSIIAVSTGQIFDDPSDIPLWAEERPGTARSIGFKAWRLVSVTADGDRRVIYTRPMPATAQRS